MQNLIKKAIENNEWRQKKTINLIPSENTPSLAVRLLTVTDPIGRYAEHRKIEALGNAEAYYYQGTKFIAEIEVELADQMKKYLACTEVEVRPISGQWQTPPSFPPLWTT